MRKNKSKYIKRVASADFGRIPTRIESRRKVKLSAEKLFLVITLLFGTIMVFLAPLFSTGDESVHIQNAYYMFSSKQPSTMRSRPDLFKYELEAISPTDTSFLDTKDLLLNKVDTKGDGFKINLINKDGSTYTSYIASGIGILVARIVYPSLGVMIYFSRFANLLLFAFSFYFLIKRSTRGKWILFMLFTIPFMARVYSPSYDVVQYIAITAFVLNFFELYGMKSIREFTKKKAFYFTFTVILLLLVKSNSKFVLFMLLGLPMLYFPIFNKIKKLSFRSKSVLLIMGALLTSGFFFIANLKFNLFQNISHFFNDYLNVESFGRAQRILFQVTPTILPSFVNILWVFCLLVVGIFEVNRKWSMWTVTVSVATYFTNWFGIYLGFWIIGMVPAVELSGRYFYPFMVLFIPLYQRMGYHLNIEISERKIKQIAVISTVLVYLAFIITVLYRVVVLNVTPLWSNKV
jgi:hypothetical protein